MTPPITSASPAPIGKAGAITRLLLSSLITFGVALQGSHSAGMKIDAWVLLAAFILVLKDAQSFINQAWGQAFHTEAPDAKDTETKE